MIKVSQTINNNISLKELQNFEFSDVNIIDFVDYFIYEQDNYNIYIDIDNNQLIKYVSNKDLYNRKYLLLLDYNNPFFDYEINTEDDNEFEKMLPDYFKYLKQKYITDILEFIMKSSSEERLNLYYNHNFYKNIKVNQALSIFFLDISKEKMIKALNNYDHSENDIKLVISQLKMEEQLSYILHLVNGISRSAKNYENSVQNILNISSIIKGKISDVEEQVYNKLLNKVLKSNIFIPQLLFLDSSIELDQNNPFFNEYIKKHEGTQLYVFKLLDGYYDRINLEQYDNMFIADNKLYYFSTMFCHELTNYERYDQYMLKHLFTELKKEKRHIFTLFNQDKKYNNQLFKTVFENYNLFDQKKLKKIDLFFGFAYGMGSHASKEKLDKQFKLYLCFSLLTTKKDRLLFEYFGSYNEKCFFEIEIKSHIKIGSWNKRDQWFKDNL